MCEGIRFKVIEVSEDGKGFGPYYTEDERLAWERENKALRAENFAQTEELVRLRSELRDVYARNKAFMRGLLPEEEPAMDSHKPCPHCGGTGYAEEEDETCAICNGSGEVPA